MKRQRCFAKATSSSIVIVLGMGIGLTLIASCEPPHVTAFGGPPRGPTSADGDAGFGWVRPADGTGEGGGANINIGGGGGQIVMPVADAGPIPPDLRTPSGFLLMSKERLELLRTRGRYAGGQELTTLRENVDDAGINIDRTGSSVENVALMYLLTQQKRYADSAWRWFKSMSSENVAGDSYLGFGDYMRGAAVVLNWCAAALTPDQQRELAEYLEKWTDELWDMKKHKGTDWGLKDPANNYYYSFVEGTAYSGYALKAAQRPNAQRFIDIAHSKVEGPNGSLAYLDKGGRGGDWEEGANYGLGSKRRMYSAFAAIASMGGPNYFARTPFTNASILYAAYQIQPGRRVLAPTGDIAREPTMSTSPFDREYVQIATYWSDDAVTRGLGAWILKEVAPSFLMETGSLRAFFYRDVLFPTPPTMTRPNNLPLHYRSVGTDWINARSGWDDNATSLTFTGTAYIEQSHAHYDTGAFLFYRNGWQAVDGNTYGHSGLKWESGAHNMITVPDQVRMNEKSRGLVQYVDDNKTMYAQIDASKLLMLRRGGGGPDSGKPIESAMEEWTRELVYVRPSALVVYDRVVPKPAGKEYAWRLHFAHKPTGADGRYTSKNGGGSIAVSVLDGGPQKIIDDIDAVDSGTSWRLEMGPTPAGRFLALVQVATGAAAPNTAAEAITGPSIQGVAWAEQVVILSTLPRGQAAPLPWTFKFRDTGSAATPRQYTFVDMKPGTSADVTITRADGFVNVRVAPGAQAQANTQGVMQLWR